MSTHLRAMGSAASICGDRGGGFTYVTGRADCPLCVPRAHLRLVTDEPPRDT